jgi:arylsulfatase A-like enzyme
MIRFSTIRLVLLVLIHFWNLGTGFCQKGQRPNILFIMSDDHTSQSWGIYGGILEQYVRNDKIKWLAEHGAILENVFCNNSICVPSRAAIMTGQYSHRNGVYDLTDPLPSDSSNFAKLLQKGGYETALFGKWHLHSEPSGFDHYSVLPGQGRYRNPVLIKKGDWKEGENGGKPYPGFSTDVITDQSISWLKSREKDKPFYLSVHFKATHEPFDYPDRYKDYLRNVEVPYPANFSDTGASVTGRTHDGWPLDLLGQRYLQQGGTLYPGDTFSVTGLEPSAIRKKVYQKFIKDYIRCAAGINDNIGRLIDHLRVTGQLENTVVIYTSDQGYFLGEHGFFDKRFIYEQSLRMPFVISYPREIRKGSRNRDIILNIDFPSLFLDFAGIPQPVSMQGRSFRDNLRGRTRANWRKDMYYRYWANEPARPAHFGIRTDRYKLALFYGQSRQKTERDQMKYAPGWEFYDLQNDPGENHNAIADPQYQEIVGKLKARLRTLKAEVGNEKETNSTIERIIEQTWHK